MRLASDQAAPGDWIQGRGWDHTLWPDKMLPTRQDIDAMTNGHPAIFVRVDGHIAVANTAALKAAGVTGKTPAPAGRQDRSATPTASPRAFSARRRKDSCWRRCPRQPGEQRRRAAEFALADAARWGITSAQD